MYIVHNIDKQKKYIGSKGFYTKTGNQTNWRTYTGSSKELNQDIKNGDRYVKSVLSIWTTKTDYLYEEIRQLVLTKAIESDWYYNDFLTRGINGRFLKEKH